MKKIAKEDIAVERYELPREEALAWAKENNEIYNDFYIYAILKREFKY